jgi:hypothetical protein
MFNKSVDKLIGPDSLAGSPFRELVRRLAKVGVEFERGLTASALNGLADRVGVPLPPDLREFWATAWPVGKGWWDWRRLDWSRAKMNDRITDELQFHVESGDFWLESWGIRPRRKAEAREVVTAWVAQGPALLPLYAHRFAVCEPVAPNTPVLSIYSSDWIYYGWNLASYLEHEFLGLDIFKLPPWPEHQSIGQWAAVLDSENSELPPVDWED